MKIKIIKNGRQEKEKYSFSLDDGTENEVVNIYPTVKYQCFEGFGGALTDAAGYVFSLMSEEQKEEFLNKYFTEEGMGYQKVRIHMDSCDFSTHMYSAIEEQSDTDLVTFTFRDTEKYIIPLLDEAEKKTGKKLKIMLSAWSPPAFMKTNGNRKMGGSLKKEYRKLWAEYLCRYIREFKNRGYEVERMSIQNEPAAIQTWESCVYSPEEEKDFLQEYLWPSLKSCGLDDVEIFIWDHNKERAFERARGVLDGQTYPMVAGIAFHWYSGDHFEVLDLLRKTYPDKKLILSESCLEFSKFDQSMEERNAARLAHDMIGNMNHGMDAFYDWNVLLDEEGGPNHVGNYCDAPYLFDKRTKKLKERAILTYNWHFAHFIKPKARRIAYSKYTSNLDMTVWENPDGSIVGVFLNSREVSIPCVLRMNGKQVRFEVEANSIVNCIISNVNG